MQASQFLPSNAVLVMDNAAGHGHASAAAEAAAEERRREQLLLEQYFTMLDSGSEDHSEESEFDEDTTVTTLSTLEEVVVATGTINPRGSLTKQKQQHPTNSQSSPSCIPKKPVRRKSEQSEVLALSAEDQQSLLHLFGS